jgi:hypothetical protein
MEDRLRRYRVMQKLEPLTDEIIERHVAMMRGEHPDCAEMDGKERIDASLKAMKFLWEACYGKPGQAIQLEGVQASKTVLDSRLPFRCLRRSS